jgi:hypothetical protein
MSGQQVGAFVVIALMVGEGLAAWRIAHHFMQSLNVEIDRLKREINSLRGQLTWRPPGVIVTGTDGTAHRYPDANRWDPLEDGSLRVIQKYEGVHEPEFEVAAFAPGTWRNVRHDQA